MTSNTLSPRRPEVVSNSQATRFRQDTTTTLRRTPYFSLMDGSTLETWVLSPVGSLCLRDKLTPASPSTGPTSTQRDRGGRRASHWRNRVVHCRLCGPAVRQRIAKVGCFFSHA